MMRPSRLLSTIATGAALGLATLAAPAAMAGNDIVKCVDQQGRVTLTDQPCGTGAASVRLAAGAPDGTPAASYGASAGGATESGGIAAPERPAAQRHVIPAAELRHSSWRPPVTAAPRTASYTAPLARDVATMKAARRALMLLEGPPPSLAGLP